ncbi:uncharacterized protein PGTG_22360 [Puccinia graminis f. sp. tritici CRL 75-36-700-3]|uniref:Uncharacterized protein n=1 Tax=Puccinia graminis f. sp. tritici (strain CRL 75-36-700-3 / race SCCL) TaxID=418459 RepID=H6QUA5_PUCGT|nr:uncharacterized protein PGTG_22360 [Puccinia graminis f. sp. tritici CRL 75-36-700-3]EHS64568.1 hypothetical protein PGTG_22360 [Puccinia graminis f. sp. tritici CRL 75-36-700-3]
MPYPTSKSNPTSRASSTRASNPTLVPAGEFKRGKSKTPTPKLASGDNPPVRDAQSGQESLSPRRGSEQSGSDGNPSKASLSVPPKPGRQPYLRAAAAQPARGLNEQGPAQRNQGNRPRRQGRMGGRPNHRREVYSEMIRMYRTLQGTYQHLDEASRINQGRN